VLTLPPEQSAPDVWTVGRIIDWTTQHLKKHGSDTPRLDTEILLAQARGCPRIQLYVDYSVPLTEAERATMRDLVRRRAQHEPVAYLVGHREFFGLDFRVTSDVLIPRPETETLVLEVITAARKWRDEGDSGADSGSAASASDEAATEATATDSPVAPDRSPLKVLELGTGSGCIAVSCAVHLPEAIVMAVDISPAALAVARVNAATHGAGERIHFLQGDLFAPLPGEERFDVIVSNPPYVAEGEMDSLPPDVRLHEPHLALRAGPEGLDIVSRLVAQAARWLNPAGLLLIEISPEQADAVVAMLAGQPEFEPASVLKDSTGRLRVVRARLKVSE